MKSLKSRKRIWLVLLILLAALVVVAVLFDPMPTGRMDAQEKELQQLLRKLEKQIRES